MPELPEVETVRRGIAPSLTGETFVVAKARRPDLRVPIPKDFSQTLEGKRIERVSRRSKYLLIHMENDVVLILHLGMSGRITLYPAGGAPPPKPTKHDHLIFETSNGAHMIFNDPRRFGLAVFAEEKTLDQHPLLEKMGPEPTSNRFHANYLEDALVKRKGPIKNALLNQKIIAGLGNIYVCEALFRSHIHPAKPANTLSQQELAALIPAIKDVINEAISAGGSSLKDYTQADGELGYFQHRFAVYGRAGEPCVGTHCKGTVERITQAGRSTFLCAACQH